MANYRKCLQYVVLGSISTSIWAGAPISCLTQGFVPLEVAYEITDGSTVSTNPQAPILTYKDSGTNPMTEAVWNAGYVPPAPYSRNTTRNLQFNESQFIASPDQVVCKTSYITTTDGYTWGTMSKAMNAMWPYDPNQYSGQSAINAYYAGNLVTTPPQGSVKVTVNYKAQNMRFWANQDGVPAGTHGAVPLNRYFIIDQWNNEYIMHASGKSTDADVQQAFNDAVLPSGWRKSIRQLKKDLTLYPSVGSDQSFQFCVFRDSADNTYHQISWSGKGSLEAQVTGMPIWGGQRNDILAGDANGPTDDVIHGAGGNDRIKPGSGADTVWGDKGIDTVILPGTIRDYSLKALSSDFTLLELDSPTYGYKTIQYCEYIKVGGKTIRISAIKKAL
jgi:hypothetical protein